MAWASMSVMSLCALNPFWVSASPAPEVLIETTGNAPPEATSARALTTEPSSFEVKSRVVVL